MTSYHHNQKVYIKSTNHTNTIIARYTYTLIIFTILTIIINLLFGNKELSVALIKFVLLSFAITSVFSYIINIIKKEYDIKKIYTDDTTIGLSLIIGLFAVNADILILVLAITLMLLIKNIKKDINLSASLYGILLLILYKYFTNNLDTPLMILKNNVYSMSYNDVISLNNGIYNYLFGINYLSPVLSVLAFIYLFNKKGIKYNLVVSYILTISIIMILYGILNDKMWFVLFELSTGSILFLTIFMLTDYKVSPTISETQIIYGMLLGIISSILRFIIPEVAVIITFILGQLFLANYFDKISYKLKYNKKIYNSLIIGCVILIIIVIVVLTIVY